MLRLRNALPLALLVSVSTYTMDKQLAVAGAEAATPSAALISTLLLSEQHQSQVATLARLQEKETQLVSEKKSTEQELTTLVAQLTAKLAAKKKQVAGSTAAIEAFKNEITKAKEDAVQKEAALKAEIAQKETELQAKIAKEEEIKKALEAEAAKLQEQLNPKEKAQVESPASAPTTGWFSWLTRK